MKNALMITGGVVAGLVLADVVTGGAVHTKALEAFQSLKSKGEETLEDVAGEVAAEA